MVSPLPYCHPGRSAPRPSLATLLYSCWKAILQFTIQTQSLRLRKINGVSSKLSTNYLIANPCRPSQPLHSLTASLLSLRIKYSNVVVSGLPALPTTVSPHSPSSPATLPDFSTFMLPSESEVSTILYNCPNKQFISDSIAWHLKNVHHS